MEIPAETDLTALKNSVESEISESINTYYRWWKIWSTADSVMTISAIFASFAAGICASGLDHQSRMVVIALAAIPGLLITINQSFKSHDGSIWFWTLVLKYQTLQRAIERGDLNYKEASRRIDEIEEESHSSDPARFRSTSVPRGFRDSTGP